MISSTLLTADLKQEVLALEKDLHTRLKTEEAFKAPLRAKYDQAFAAKRTSSTFISWAEEQITQSAVALFGLLLWSLEDGMNSVNHAPTAVQAAFFDWLREHNGTALNLIASALKDHPGRLVSLGLALGVIFPMDGSAQDEARDAKIRLERHLGDIEIGTSQAQSWHRAAKAVMSLTKRESALQGPPKEQPPRNLSGKRTASAFATLWKAHVFAICNDMPPKV